MVRSISKVLILLALVFSLCFSFASCDDDLNSDSNFENGISDDSASGGNELDSEKQETSDDQNNQGNGEDQKIDGDSQDDENKGSGAVSSFDLSIVPEYDETPYYVINDNNPFFDESELVCDSYEFYGELDELGRCTVTMACISTDIMPTEDRGSISDVYPTGWIQAQYDCVSGTYLYNRCHLIGYQLTGENANELNLITGTKYLNNEGMLPFENMIADYIKETENHVIYRVTPIFKGNELLARGVLLEAYSIEDSGEGICFNLFFYNVQPGICLDYATGESSLCDDENNDKNDNPSSEEDEDTETPNESYTYIINTKSKKIHTLGHYSSDEVAESANMKYTTQTMQELLDLGYTACGTCDPE